MDISNLYDENEIGHFDFHFVIALMLSLTTKVIAHTSLLLHYDYVISDVYSISIVIVVRLYCKQGVNNLINV